MELGEISQGSKSIKSVSRRLPVGAEVLRGGGGAGGAVDFRVWAPKRRKVQVVVFDSAAAAGPSKSVTLDRERDGYFSKTIPDASAGALYGFYLDAGKTLLPDPASRFQPDGPRGLSQVVDPDCFPWSDAAWKGRSLPGQVIYEMHIGTFTPEGTWRAAQSHLPEVADAGMTVLEVMPVNEFPGRFGWGYDGVFQFAPLRMYGMPDDFRSFVDRAHALGLAVILDVVYNHFGNFECPVGEFSDDYYSQRYENEWGAPVNFDGENAQPVRDFFLANVRHWIEEYHLDGFRFDATQSIFDASGRHILEELQATARRAAGGRPVIITAENEPQHIRIVRPVDQGGHGFDAMGNDDFHHTARVRLTGLTEAYYSDYLGTVDELASAIKGGFLYQGQISQHQKQRRGTSTRGIAAPAFVHFLQNHDQIANAGNGERIHKLTSPARLRAMTALWLLGPQTPLFFQGQEFAASSPFLYFADLSEKGGEFVAEGRDAFLAQFPSLDTDESKKSRPRLDDCHTFERCKLDWAERRRNRQAVDFHRDLLDLRRNDSAFRRQRSDLLETAVLRPDCLVVRYYDDESGDRLLLVNFGRQFLYSPSPEPLLAVRPGSRWELTWSSESVRYGGRGTPRVESEKGWDVPAEAAVVLSAVPDR